jgi:hypothetical protein
VIDSSNDGGSTKTLPATSSNAEVLRFDAQRATQAIIFHLVDGGTAKRVGQHSLQRTVNRLSRDSQAMSVSREQWASMKDPQRLDWLLGESHTGFEILSDGTAILRHKK